MSSANGSHGDEGLDAAVAYVAGAYERIDAREQELRGQLQLVHEERTRLRTALRALAPDHPLAAASKPGPKQKKSKPRPMSMRPDAFDRVWAWIKEHGDDFTVPEAIDAMEGDPSHEPVRRAITQLRDAQAIRLVGKGGKSGTAQVFRVLDVGAGDRFARLNAEQFAASGAH